MPTSILMESWRNPRALLTTISNLKHFREVFFADERVVPLDHPDSNYASVNEHLFSKVAIPKQNIHVIDVTKLDDPEAVADEYEKQLVAAFVGKDSVAFPRFDLCLLGIGPE